MREILLICIVSAMSIWVAHTPKHVSEYLVKARGDWYQANIDLAFPVEQLRGQ